MSPHTMLKTITLTLCRLSSGSIVADPTLGAASLPFRIELVRIRGVAGWVKFSSSFRIKELKRQLARLRLRWIGESVSESSLWRPSTLRRCVFARFKREGS